MGRVGSLLLTGLRRAVYALVALPVALGCLVLLAVGQAGRATSARLGTLHSLAGARAPSGADLPRSRLARHLLLSLPLDVVACAVAGYAWLLLPANLLYPVRLAMYDETATDSWGGPSLAGAWAVHAAGGVASFVVVGLPVTAGLAWVQSRLAERTLGGPA